MATKDDILGQFQLFNIKPSEEVLSKCLEMCLKYSVDGEDMVDQWFAYTSSVLRGAAPTVGYLEQMERKEFAKNKDQELKRPVYDEEMLPKQPKSPIAGPSNHYSPPNSDVLSTPKRDHTPIPKTPVTPLQTKTLEDDAMDTTTISPSVPFGIYTKRTDARTVCCSHGPSQTKFERTTDIDLVIKPVYEDGLRPNQTIMYEALRKRGKSINNMTEDLAGAIALKYALDLNDDGEQITRGDVLLYGRILHKNSEGKINSRSLVLEQTQNVSGRTVALNLSKTPKYSLFTGQVVVVKGARFKAGNHTDTLMVEEIYSDTNMEFLSEPPLVEDTLQLVVACGPFTVQENLSFEPLNDLLQYVKEHKPHVLILTGPFYHKHHQGIHNGELRQSFDSFFFDLIDNLMGEVQDTHVIVVASHKEPHHFPVYPTAPYQVRRQYPNLTFMPDPCMVNINGLVVGTTTADILFDIGSFEVHTNKANSGPPDRMRRLASHLLHQESFYPLDPPGKGMCIDFSLMERNGVMGVKPHLLVLPSNLRYFVKEIDGCVVINPERLTKGNGGGTFARIEISPGSSQTICDRMACQVLKI